MDNTEQITTVRMQEDLTMIKRSLFFCFGIGNEWHCCYESMNSSLSVEKLFDEKRTAQSSPRWQV